jgi:HAD superfamily hydrolase (TIGR01450 family)
MSLADARGFVFDLDGTLVQRSPSGSTAIPGANELISTIRRSRRPFAVFTNASHTDPAVLARGVRDIGLDVSDAEMITPLCSAARHLHRSHPDANVFMLGTEAAKNHMRARGIRVSDDEDGGIADVVFVGHVDALDIELAERAAWAIIAGARFLTANAAPAYAGADGPILSRGAMLAAAIAKASGQTPTVVGKPSRPAVREVRDRLGVPSTRTAVIGDDLGMDIALGQLGGAFTVLVASGISGGTVAPASRRRAPDLVVPSVAALLDLVV